MGGQLYVISGPSGVGKTTIIKLLRNRVTGLGYSVSHTSRKPRSNEIDGVNYHFVDKETFRKMIEVRAFVEWAEVYDDLYGTALSSVQSQTAKGLDVVMDLDSHGAMNIKKQFTDSVSVYILPPSLKVLEQRLRERASDDEETINTRLEKASNEIQRCADYDHIVFNEDLDVAVNEVASIIVSQRSRKSKRLSAVEKAFHISLSP